MASFTDSSVEGALPCWVSDSFWSVYFSPNLPKKCLMYQYLLTYPYLTSLVVMPRMTLFLYGTYICFFFVMEVICVDVFLHLLCCWFILKFLFTITLTFTLHVGFYMFVAWASFLYSFDFIDMWWIWHAAFGPVALASLISHIYVTYIP